MTTTVGGTVLTMADWASRVEPDGKIAEIVEVLGQTNEMLDDMLVAEGNLPTGNKTTVRTGYPTATWRLLNYGVAKGKSTTASVIDSCGMLEAYSEVDKDLAELNGGSAQFRFSEDLAFLEGMNQQMQQTMIYGNSAVNPERFTGYTPRYSTITAANAATAANVISGLGSGGANTSGWVIGWGANKSFGFFPKGKVSGLQHINLGEHTLIDAVGGMYQGYRTHFKWDLGLAVRDWRYCVRIANIDVAALIAGTGVDLIKALTRAVYRLPSAPQRVTGIKENARVASGGSRADRISIYFNRTALTYLDIQATAKTNLHLTMDQIDGKPYLSFRGIPIRLCDQILNTEANVT
jgi:hypothetical protein